MTDGPAHEVHPDNTRIPVPAGQLPNPEDFDCEWCGETAEVRVEVVNKQGMKLDQSIYACRKHEHLAEALRVRSKR